MTNWFELAVEICHGTEDVLQCDICIGKPEDWCDKCDTCIHQCQCNLDEEE